MDRRKFIQLGAAGGVAAIALPQIAQANAHGHQTQVPAGGMFYTSAQPGRWNKKVKPHLPIIEIAENRIQVTTNHPMAAHGHYITKHVLLDKDFKYLTEKVFDPNSDKKAISAFNMKRYKGTLYVVSHCNLHDSWLNDITI